MQIYGQYIIPLEKTREKSNRNFHKGITGEELEMTISTILLAISFLLAEANIALILGRKKLGDFRYQQGNLITWCLWIIFDVFQIAYNADRHYMEIVSVWCFLLLIYVFNAAVSITELVKAKR